MIEHSLDQIRNMRDGDSKDFYEDEGVHEHIGSDVDSISGDADEMMSNDGQMDAAAAAAPVAAHVAKAIGNGMPVKTPSLSNGVASNGAHADKQFAQLAQEMRELKNAQAMFVSLIGGKVASLNTNTPGVKRKTFKAVCETSLAKIDKDSSLARFTPEVSDLQKALGAGANITEVLIKGYDLSASPISIGIVAPPNMAQANHDHLSVGGSVMFEAQRMTKETFDVPLVAYVGTEYSIGKDILTRFPDVTVDNVGEKVKESPVSGMVLIPVNDVVAAAVSDELDKMKADAEKAGKTYTGPTYNGLFKPDFNALHVDKAIATRAMNTLLATLMTSNKAFNTNNDLYFDFVRTVLSKDSVDRSKSSQTSAWTDKRELSTFLKGGATIDSMLNSVFSASLTIEVKYTLPEKK